MPRLIQGSQTDFSFGEVDTDLKRNDQHPARKGGLRQMLNARIHNAGVVQNRSGRSALFPAPTSSRIEELTMSPGNDFKLAFGPNELRIFNAAGAQVALFTNLGSGLAPLPWTSTSDIRSIVYALMNLSITITFGHAMRPQVVSWDGVATWSIVDYNENVTAGGQKRAAFYRISAQNIFITPSATVGAITVTFSQPVVVAGMTGTRIRYIQRQILLGSVVSPTVINATVIEPLPSGQVLSVTSSGGFQVGDEVIGGTSGAKGIVTILAATITVQLISTGTAVISFVAGEALVGPAASTAITGVAAASPQASPIWDEEIMNTFRGFPASCFVDQFRLGFCNFTSVPGGIGWSAINSPNDMYVGANPSDAMFELAPSKVQVQHVLAGPESSEFVFCDRRIYYIPISPTNPLKPGSVAFQLLSGDGSTTVQPRIAQEAILYVNAGGSTVMAVIATGAYQRPFTTKSLTDFHAHLFKNIQCIAAPGADGTFNERYAYVLNGNGSISVGKYNADTLTGNAPVIGWGPWNGVGVVQWIAAWAQDVLFTSSYSGASICEILDDTRYLDASIFVNAAPAAFAPPLGKGPLWFLANQTVTLMDQGTRPMGPYQVDANGFIVPQFNGGENLLAATLVAGHKWSGIIEPFAPIAPSGADQHQRMNARAFAYFGAYVLHSTGFILQSLFSGKQTKTAPALGTVMKEHRVPAYSIDDDATLPPIQRETMESFPPPGTTFDPRAAIAWDTPGPLEILEIAMETSS